MRSRILLHRGACQGLAWFRTSQSLSPGVIVLLGKMPQKHQMVPFNLKLEILLLWSNKEPLWLDNTLSVPLQKRVSYTRNFQNHRLKASVSSKGWKCITGLPKIIEKILVVLLKESLQSMKSEIFLGDKNILHDLRRK